MGCIKLHILDQQYKNTELKVCYINKELTSVFCFESTCSNNGYKFNAKELQTEMNLNWLDYGFRFYDPTIGRWMAPDPMIEKHYSWTPYAYVYNNPIRFTDPFGLDSAQRAQAVALANEYVAQNPGNTWRSGGREAPGGFVDCSGMVSNTIIAGEEPDPYVGRDGNGVSRIVQASEEVTDNNNIEAGNVVALDNSTTGTTNSMGHIGIITEVQRDANGNVTGYRIADSGGRPSTGVSGPRHTDITIGGNRYWDSRVTGVYKWDTRPDVINGGTLPAVTIQGQGTTYRQPIRPTLIRR